MSVPVSTYILTKRMIDFINHSCYESSFYNSTDFNFGGNLIDRSKNSTLDLETTLE